MVYPTFKLSEFEGPLELMLHLISKHKLNIEDIEISLLLEQYLHFIDHRADIDLEVDSAFIEMAAHLVHIKTVMLLPKHEDEAKDLKSQLTQQLMEYQACRAAAEFLREREAKHLVYVRAPMDLQLDPTYTGTMPLSALLIQMGISESVKRRKAAPSPAQFAQLVSRRTVSVTSRIINVLKRLYRKGSMEFEQAFVGAESRSHIVATFLGILELIKAGRVVTDPDNTSITLVKNADKLRSKPGEQ